MSAATVNESAAVNEPATLNDSTVVNDVVPNWGKPWYRVAHLRKLIFLTLTVELVSSATGYDGYLVNGLQILPQWLLYFYLPDPNAYRLGAMVLAPIFGMIVSYYPSIILADNLGRRPAILISTVGVVGMSIFQAASNNYKILFVSRFLLGFFGAASGLAAPSLVSEISYPTHRGPMTALYNTFYNLGAIISAAVTLGCYYWPNYSTWAWRLPTGLQGLLPLCSLIFLYWVPESPRFLIKKGKLKEARAMLEKWHAGNDLEVGGALVDLEFAEILGAVEKEKESEFSMIYMFKTAANRRRLGIVLIISFCMQMSGNGLTSFYLADVLRSIGIVETVPQLKYSLGITIFGWGTSVIQAVIIGRLRRRVVLLSCIAFMLCTFTIWTAVSWVNTNEGFTNPSMGKAVLAMIFLTGLAYNLGLNGLPYLYFTEVLPSKVRATGLAYAGISQACWTVYNGFVNAIALDNIGSRYYLVFVCFLLFEFVLVYFFCPETYGYTLEEVSKIFGDYAEPDFDFTAVEKQEEIEHGIPPV